MEIFCGPPACFKADRLKLMDIVPLICKEALFWKTQSIPFNSKHYVFSLAVDMMSFRVNSAFMVHSMCPFVLCLPDVWVSWQGPGTPSLLMSAVQPVTALSASSALNLLLFLVKWFFFTPSLFQHHESHCYGWRHIERSTSPYYKWRRN